MGGKFVEMQSISLAKNDYRSGDRILWINNTKILSAFIVVFLHESANVISGLQDINSTNWWIANTFDSISRWCIPIFVMISGMLLLDTTKDEPILVFYRKRVSRIFIPLVFWTLFFLLFRYFGEYFVKGTHPSIGSLTNSVLAGEPYFHMWYLYMIIGLYLFTPFFRRVVRQLSDNKLWFLFSVLLAFSMIGTFYISYYTNISLPATFKFVFYIPYFFAGYLINKTKFNPPGWILYVTFILSVVFTGLGYHSSQLGGTYNSSNYFYNYLSITVVPMSISVIFLLKRFTIPIINSAISNKLALLSFGIYLIHPAVLDSLPVLGLQRASYNPLLSIPLIAVFAFIVALIASMIISKIPIFKRIIG
jgi:surface polysaccharide O-acyltransferase-like enzyme